MVACPYSRSYDTAAAGRGSGTPTASRQQDADPYKAPDAGFSVDDILAEFYSGRETSLYTTDAVDTTAARAVVQSLDDLLASHTTNEAWVAADRPTVADLALFPAAALSRDIGIDHDRYPALRSWIRRIKQLPGFVEMPGIPVFP